MSSEHIYLRARPNVSNIVIITTATSAIHVATVPVVCGGDVVDDVSDDAQMKAPNPAMFSALGTQ